MRDPHKGKYEAKSFPEGWGGLRENFSFGGGTVWMLFLKLHNVECLGQIKKKLFSLGIRYF